MSKRAMYLVPLIAVIYCTKACGEVITNGMAISTTCKAMEAAGYKETGLDMAPLQPGQELKFWSVGEGVLIASYSKETSKLIGLGLWLSDERPKAFRKTFDFEVTAFDTRTGLMTIRVTRTKPRKPN